MHHSPQTLPGRRALTNPARWARFTWSKRLTHPYESLWSMVHKFALLNVVDSKALNPVLFPEGPPRGLSLADPGAATGVFQQLLQLEESEGALDVDYVPPPFLTEFPPTAVTSRHLRYCLECAKRGFHTPLYQFLGIRRCPLHGQALIDYCPECGRKLPLGLTRATLRNAYGCACGYPLWSGLVKGVPPMVPARELEPIAQWLSWCCDQRKRSLLIIDHERPSALNGQPLETSVSQAMGALWHIESPYGWDSKQVHANAPTGDLHTLRPKTWVRNLDRVEDLLVEETHLVVENAKQHLIRAGVRKSIEETFTRWAAFWMSEREQASAATRLVLSPLITRLGRYRPVIAEPALIFVLAKDLQQSTMISTLIGRLRRGWDASDLLGPGPTNPKPVVINEPYREVLVWRDDPWHRLDQEIGCNG